MSTSSGLRTLRPHTALLAAALLVASVSAEAGIVTNGSFESDATHEPNRGDSTGSHFIDGSTDIPGWTVYAPNPGTNVEWLANYNDRVLRAQDGNDFIDLTGLDAKPFGGVQQLLATTAGTTYTLKFWLGFNLNSYGGPVSANVFIGDGSGTVGTTQNFATTNSESAQFPGDANSNVWQSFTEDFVATSDSTLLRLTGDATANGVYIGLDDVSVVAAAVTPADPGAVPEPAPLALLGLGGIAALIARRRSIAR